MNDQLLFTLQIADNALILGHRLSEWCGHGPILEQDIALTNISLDHLGQARSLYQYAATQYNALTDSEKKLVFNSPMLHTSAANKADIDEDDLAYLRDSWDFRNALLVEQPNNDWAYTVARSFYFDAYNFYFYTALLESTDQTLAAIAEKSLKEVAYHTRWSSEWVMRLGDGTAESHDRMQKAINELWMYTGELFEMSAAEKNMLGNGIGVNLELVKNKWTATVTKVVADATLTLPPSGWMQNGGKEGRHTEHLGYILAELQFMQRAYPGMEW